ncbi:MAG: hypothetical protein QW116_00785 [Zestosphaera sp.]
MTIVNEFSVASPLDASEVLTILADLQLHLSLWPVLESLAEVLSDNEVLADLKVGDSLSRVHLKMSTSKEGEVTVITVEGHNDLSLELRLSVVGRKLVGRPLTLIRGRIVVKSANEKALKPYIKTFVEAYQNRLIGALPTVLDAWRKGLVKKMGVRAAAPPPVEAAPKELPKREELPKPELKLEGVNLVTSPTALDDEVLVSNIILKSQILSTMKEELSGLELLRRLSEMYTGTGLKTLYTLAIDAEGNKVRVLFRDDAIVGVRVELREGTIISGVDAVKRLKELDKKVWRISTYSIPNELFSS